jgi:hypothetical protein
MKKDNKEKFYKTTNFHIFSWLIQNGIKVESVDWTNRRRAEFVFKDFKDREVLVNDFFKQDLIQGKITADQKAKAIMYANNPPMEYDRPTR